MLSEDMDEVLRAYFRWASQNAPEDIGFSRTEPTMRILFGGGISCAGLSDDEALCVDRSIAQLKLEDDETYKILKLIYRDGRSLRWMEMHGYGDRKTLARQAWSARQFIRGSLFTLKIMGTPPPVGSPAMA